MANKTDVSPAAPIVTDASKLCLTTSANLVDPRGRTKKKVFMRLSTTLFYANFKEAEKAAAGRFQPENLGDWCKYTAARRGQDGPARECVPLDRTGQWHVAKESVHVPEKLFSAKRTLRHRVSVWRRENGAGGDTESEKNPARVTFDFGSRLEEADLWFDTFRGTVTPLKSLFGVGEAGDATYEAVQASPVETRADDHGEDEEDCKTNTRANPVSSQQAGKGHLHTLLSSGSSRLSNKATRHVLDKAGSKLLLRTGVPITSPHFFVAKKALGVMYKRRFSLKMALTRTASQRAYAALYRVRYAYMHELVTPAGGLGLDMEQGNGGELDTTELIEGIEEIESTLRQLDMYMLGSRGAVSATVGTGPFAIAEKVAAERGRFSFVDQWAEKEGESVDQLLRSAGSGFGSI